MDKAWLEMTKQNVYEILQQTDFNHPDFNLNELKSHLSQMLGVKPSVKLTWETTERINELKRASGVDDYIEKTDTIRGIDIVFVDTDNKPLNFKFIL